MTSFIETFYKSITPKNDGSNGFYRGANEFNLSGANTDAEAITAFLGQYKNTPATHRTYCKEIERFQMWCVLILNKSITDLLVEDYRAYIEFLKNPDDSWISETKVPKSHESWRPFTFIPPESPSSNQSQSLSKDAVKIAVASINSMLNWMVDAGYLRMNALKILRQRDKGIGAAKSDESKVVERFLDNEMWDAAIEAVESMPKVSQIKLMHYERAKFIMTMASMLGPRVSEMSNSIMGDFQRGPGGWFWKVNGKGDKEAEVAIPQDMINRLIQWREFLGLPALPSRDDKRPVIPAINKSGLPLFYTAKSVKTAILTKKQSDLVPRHGLSPRRINEILKEIFYKAAKKLPLDKADIIKKASAHWMRHTSVSQKISSGMDINLVQEDARHSDAKTTKRYTHDQLTRRSSEAQKHKLRWVKD